MLIIIIIIIIIMILIIIIIIIGKIYKKCNSQTQARVPLSLALFSIVALLWKEKTFSHFVCLHRQHNTVSCQSGLVWNITAMRISSEALLVKVM